MSLASLAPTEKTEHLIYSIFPLSFATWIVSNLELRLLSALSTVLALTSFLTLILYEFTPDQWLLNAILRFKSRRRQSLKEAILIFNLLDRPWERQVTTVYEDYFEDEVKKHVSITVNNPHIRRISWRIRGSSWLLVSSYFIVYAYHNFSSSISFEATQNFLSQIPVLIRDNHFLVLCILVLFIILFGYIRHRKLFSRIDQLTRFSYLQNIITVMKLNHPEILAESAPKDNDQLNSLKRKLRRVHPELKTIHESLLAGNWDIFMDRWDRIYHWVHRKVVEEVELKMAYYLLSPLSKFYEMLHDKKAKNPYDEAQTLEDSKKELGWVCHFYELILKLAEERENINKKWSRRIGNAIRDSFSRPPKPPKQLPFPEFNDELKSLKRSVCKEDINFHEKDILFSFVDKLSVMNGESVAAAIIWAFSSLTTRGERNKRQDEGLKLLLSQFKKNEYNINLQNAARMFLLAFEKNGIGGSIKLDDFEQIKDFRSHVPDDMIDQWNRAFIRFIGCLDKTTASTFTSDSNFVLENARGKPDVIAALQTLQEKISSTELKRILSRLG
jgi:hypothetical protein